MNKLVAGICLAVALSACGIVGPSRPPQQFLSLRVDPSSPVIVAQVESYYGEGGETRWRDLGNGRYALDISDHDPLTNEPRTINFLFETTAARADFPEPRASVSELALNGERLSFADIRATLATISAATGAPSRAAFPSRGTDVLPGTAQLLCEMRDSATAFGSFKLSDLDAVYAARNWSRYERPGGQLQDGRPFIYFGYAADAASQERTEFAAAPTGNTVEIIAQHDFDQSGAVSDWRSGLHSCNNIAQSMTPQNESAQASEAIIIPGVEPGMNYAAARQVILASQEYFPIRVPYRLRDCDERVHASCSTYPELMDCSGTGTNICRTIYRRRSDNRMLVVYTAGEWNSDFGNETGVQSVAWADLQLAASFEYRAPGSQ